MVFKHYNKRELLFVVFIVNYFFCMAQNETGCNSHDCQDLRVVLSAKTVWQMTFSFVREEDDSNLILERFIVQTSKHNQLVSVRSVSIIENKVPSSYLKHSLSSEDLKRLSERDSLFRKILITIDPLFFEVPNHVKMNILEQYCTKNINT